MAARSLAFTLTHGTVEAGLWCDEHALPHGIRADVMLLSADGVDVVGTYSACDEDG